MPTYGYRCTACGHEFERFQKITDPAVSACESCDAPVKKLLYPVGIQFKGAGFYINDYARAGANSSEAKAESGAKSDPAAKSEPSAKSDPAPAPAKTDAKPATGSS